MTEHEEAAQRLLPCQGKFVAGIKLFNCRGEKSSGILCENCRRHPAVAAALAQAEAEGRTAELNRLKGHLPDCCINETCGEDENLTVGDVVACTMNGVKSLGKLTTDEFVDLSDIVGDLSRKMLHAATKERDAEIARLKAEVARLWRPMECGHPNACYSYLGPADNNPAPDEKLPKPCLACRYGDAAEARGRREGLDFSKKAADWFVKNGGGAADVYHAIDAEIAKAGGK